MAGSDFCILSSRTKNADDGSDDDDDMTKLLLRNSLDPSEF